jgi:hypothetical protein
MFLALFLPLQTAPAGDDGVSIVHLAFADHIVTISSSPQGSLFSVRMTSGALVDENLTEDQLLAGYPELYDDIRSSYASDEAGNLMWAGRSHVQGRSPRGFD